jgi:hypothetical protein
MTLLNKLWLLPPRSLKHRLRSTVLAPDQTPICVDWGKFEPGASIFVPCVNTVECGCQLNEVANNNKWKIDMRARIEDGLWGVRAWRVS